MSKAIKKPLNKIQPLRQNPWEIQMCKCASDDAINTITVMIALSNRVGREIYFLCISIIAIAES